MIPIYLFLLTIALLSPEPSTIDLERAKIHDVQKAYWESISTLELSGEEYSLDSNFRRLTGPKTGHLEHRVIYGSRGRFWFRRISVDSEGKIGSVHQFRENGRVFLGITPFEDDVDSLSMIVIRNQTDKPNLYENEMCLAFWGWMPGGKPIHIWLEEGGVLTIEKSKDGREVPVISSTHRKIPIRIELDPDHDWLPRSVNLEKHSEFKTLRYERDQGHWFPGIVREIIEPTSLPPGCDIRIEYKMIEMHINRAVPKSIFEIPQNLDGVVVQDQRNWTGYCKGGIQARKRLEKAHGDDGTPKRSPDDRSPDSQVIASTEPPRLRWEIAIAIVSLFVLACAWKLRRG
jgi:hypothetical protein